MQLHGRNQLKCLNIKISTSNVQKIFLLEKKATLSKIQGTLFLSVVSLLYFREMNVGQTFLSLHFAKVPLKMACS